MSPVTIILVTFGVWALVKGKAATYWSFATVHNASTGAGSNPSATGVDSPTTGAAVTVPIDPSSLYGSTAGTTAGQAAAGGAGVPPALPVPTVPPVPPVPTP